MATSTDDKWVIDKLDGKNWSTWKFQMKHLLLAKGLWGLVDGSETLAEDANAAARAEFQKRSQRTFSTIVLAIGTSQLYLVTSCEQPRKAWEELRNHFERDTLANKLFLKKQYFRLEMKEGTSIEKHLKHMKELTDRLAAIGAPIDEEDQVVTLLGSLPKSYSTLVTALESRGDDISPNYVQQALVHEEQKMQERGHSESDDHRRDSALVGDSKRRFKPRKPICYGCQQPGHYRRDCPKTKKGPHTAEIITEEATESESEDGANAFTAGKDCSQRNRWLVDSGASSHMTWDKELLTDYQEFETPQKVGLGDGRQVDALGTGKVYLEMRFKVSQPKMSVMYRVLYVPQLACNLFSVRAASSKGIFIKFGHSRCWIRGKNGKLLGMGTMVDRLYCLDCEIIQSTEAATLATKSRDSDLDVWHYRLGHASEHTIKNMAHKQLASGITLPKQAQLSFCEGCVAGKMTRKPFWSVGEIRSKRKLRLVHSDVCGPMPTESIGGNKYFVTFIDDFSRCCAVYFLRSKSEVPDKFKEFEARVSNDSGERIGTLRSDNGGEYLSKEFRSYLKSRGIHHELTVPYSPQQNGVAERMNRTLLETARSMMAHAGLPGKYWAEAVETASYIRNRTPTSALDGNKTPLEAWSGRKPNVSNMKVFGCIAYAHVPDTQRQKLDQKAVKLRFVGYSVQSKGYRLLDEKTSQVYTRRDVIFNEQDFGKNTEKPPQSEEPETLKVQSEPDNESKEQEEPSPPRRQSERTRQSPVRFGRDEYVAATSVQHVAYAACQIAEPQTMEEARSGEHSDKWKQAADSEYDSLLQNETWDLVPLPSGRKPIGSRWVFKVKYGANGKVERFKARLVAKGYAQRPGIDYEETFSPVVRYQSIRTLLAFDVQNDMLLHQMDVVTAFLNGTLEEDIYMEQPDGYVEQGKEDLVCKLRKSLYGLKQSPRCWNKAFTEFMKSIGFNQGTADPCIYVRDTCIVAVYVDDLIIATKTLEEMQEVKQLLSSQFQMKDMGKLHYCLGITIEQDKAEKSIRLHQKQYLLKMLKKFKLEDAKPVSTPADPNVKICKDDGVSKAVDSTTYQSMVGSVLYASIATRPDISQAVAVVSRYSSNPSEAHLTAVKRVLRYLKGTLDITLKYRKSDKDKVLGFSDADYAGDVDDRHSTTGNLFLMSGGPISWLSKKQPIVTLSTAEAEYVALSTATTEAVWIRKLLLDFGVSQSQATTIMEDNQGAICLARNPVTHSRSKHIDIRYHYIREALNDGIIKLQYCPTHDMLADTLTKPLPKGRFVMIRNNMGLVKPPDT